MSDLAALVVALPIFGSLVAFLAALVRSKSGWPVAVAATAAQLAVTVTLAVRAFGEGTITYVVGGFEAPYGIELVVDGLTGTMLVLIAAVSLGVLAYARRAGPRSNPFYAVFMLLVAGLTGMSVTADLFNMYVFLEITGLSAYALVASGDRGRSAVAALKYLLVGTVGASLFLLGVGYAYIDTGTLNMADLAVKLAANGYTATLTQTAFALIVVGLFIKVAVFPLHTWQPDAYAGAPDTVSGLISALVSTVAAYALLRVVFTVFGTAFLDANPFAHALLVGGAIISILLGSLLAVSQSEVKRMLAYSSVSQFGLIVAAISIGNVTALTGAAVHLVGHAIMKGGLFLTAGLVATETGARSVDEYEGLVKRSPVGAGVFGVLAVAMVGVPPTIGFAGKWYIAVGAAEAGSWTLLAVIVGSTLLTLAYFARLVERMFFREPTADLEPAVERADGALPDGGDLGGSDPGSASLGMYAAVVAAAVLAVALGFAVFGYGDVLQSTIEALLS
ncbi:monovalent cation/H+ antiporter subunit D family protein [Halobacterium bonnevillei]|uniref:Monovalent cation/H+ antiporter subunit D family protein n=1 Tax=Halobacterium bonnevillei TaxID=2692200 RepID=A0A6B0SMH7_9EURY|nr:monovalent cation/H+ antiporter subunit D family protein [Halobacterium bonnevillei]MXR20901.1 monovalent cation/H+ antiporter subunit D family protein [Halobacterium bonnevillei]